MRLGTQEKLESVEKELDRSRKERKSLEGRIYVLENLRIKDDARYRALTQDYEKVADQRVELQKEFDRKMREKEITNETLQGVQSRNTELKNEIVRLSAPKFATPKFSDGGRK